MPKKEKETGFRSRITSLMGNDVFIDPNQAGEIEKFSSGSLVLDVELKGGYPKGKMIEATGDPGTGKTTSAIHCAVEFQKAYPDEEILWLDLEKVFDNEYNKSLGLDTSHNFTLVRPSTGEDAWTLMIEFAREVQGGLIVLDSVSLLLPIKEYEGDMGDAQMASAARMNSQGLRKIMPHVGKNNTTIFVINQMRTNIGGYGQQMVTTGGKGWSYYARTRLRFFKSMPTDKKELGVFNETKIKLEKATYGNEYSTAETRIVHGEGFDIYGEVVDLATVLGIIDKAGSWYSIDDTKLGQGKTNVSQLFKDNPELFLEIKEKVSEKIKNNG